MKLPHRKTCRRTWRRPFRSAHRSGFRQRWRAPDDLGLGLTAFRRAIRAHRRLARLAPHHFDFAVVERDQLEHQERLRWQAVWQPALEKAYGPPTPAERAAELHADWLASQPPKLHPRTQRAVDVELAAWHDWMDAGKLAWARHRQRRPHALISLGRLAQMLEIAFAFGRLATGLDSNAPPFEPHNDEAVWADLRRAYGTHELPPASSHQEAAPPPFVAASAPVGVAAPPAADPVSHPPVVPVASPPASTTAAPPPPPRCDAYRRLARQLNRRQRTMAPLL
jgi:hypothetical protein